MSSKRERFVRVAERRTNNALTDLRLLGNCSNRQNYEFTPEDVKRIFQALDSEVRRIKSLFETSLGNARQFTLKNK
jgi:mRNA-degrading endonuclease HigB of HigAB toxin-antitoxin module